MLPNVQAVPSSQGLEFAVLTQPFSLSHLSSVHGLLSSQLPATPVHFPSAQTPDVTHPAKLTQGALLGVAAQPLTLLQLSSVQRLPSSHWMGTLSATNEATPAAATVELGACVVVVAFRFRREGVIAAT